jgi:3-hydroxyisobutyrate dehydrogenase-like beta-hydroxyacid dehydrogenase
MTQKIAFIGLGVMGAPMAGHLSKNGYDVSVYSRTQAKARAWVERFSGTIATSPADAATNADFVFSCVGNDDDVRAITIGSNGAFLTMQPGSIFVDHTTTSAHVARELAAVASKSNLSFIDAPVSGGQAGAENGALTVMCGGNAEAFTKTEPVIRSYAKACRLMGDAGAGQLTKMVNQICIAGLVQALSEGIHFAECAGLDVEAVLDVISKGAASSWQMENRGKTMHARKFDFGFAVDLMRKDLDIVLDEAKGNGAQLPVADLVNQFYAEIQNAGGNRLDTSSLIIRLKA